MDDGLTKAPLASLLSSVFMGLCKANSETSEAAALFWGSFRGLGSLLDCHGRSWNAPWHYVCWHRLDHERRVLHALWLTSTVSGLGFFAESYLHKQWKLIFRALALVPSLPPPPRLPPPLATPAPPSHLLPPLLAFLDVVGCVQGNDAISVSPPLLMQPASPCCGFLSVADWPPRQLCLLCLALPMWLDVTMLEPAWRALYRLPSLQPKLSFVPPAPSSQFGLATFEFRGRLSLLQGHIYQELRSVRR